MYLRRPFYPQFFNATRGWCVSADYTYSECRSMRLLLLHNKQLGADVQAHVGLGTNYKQGNGADGNAALPCPAVVGVNNELATRHIPEIEPRHDTLAGPYGRRGDQVRSTLLSFDRTDVAKRCLNLRGQNGAFLPANVYILGRLCGPQSLLRG